MSYAMLTMLAWHWRKKAEAAEIDSLEYFECLNRYMEYESFMRDAIKKVFGESE